MSCPFPKAGSDGESAECLIENTPRTKRGPPRIALISLGLLIGIILEMIVFGTFFIHWISQCQSPPMLGELTFWFLTVNHATLLKLDSHGSHLLAWSFLNRSFHLSSTFP